MENLEVQNEVDLFCHACDYSFLAVQENDASLSTTYRQRFNAILSFLHERKFSYYFCSIWQWESSRSRTPAILFQPYVNKTPPIFIEAEHTCSDCADRMQPCTHPCCRLWFQEAFRKCGYGHPDAQTCTSNAKTITTTIIDTKQMKETQGSKHHPRTSATMESSSKLHPKVTPKCTRKPNASLLHHDFPLSTKSARKQPAASRTQAPPHLKQDIKELLRCLTDYKGLLKDRLTQLKQHILDQLEMWTQLSPDERKNFHNNMKYISKVLGCHASTKLKAQVRSAGTIPWMERQGRSNYCALCAINNVYGSKRFSIEQLDYIADDLWLRQFEQCGMTITEELQAQRDTAGFYALQVMQEAFECFGDVLVGLQAKVAQLELEATSVASFVDRLLEGYSVPANLIIYWTSRDHFTNIRVENAALWHFDSSKKMPVNLSRLKFYEIITNNPDYIFILVPSSRRQSSPTGSLGTEQTSSDCTNISGLSTFKTAGIVLIPTSIVLRTNEMIIANFCYRNGRNSLVAHTAS